MDLKETEDGGFTMADYVKDMVEKEQVAQQILSKNEAQECTYNKGYITQSLFGCNTCGIGGGMCLACSLECHQDHDVFEIELKRNFRCDCGTSKFNKRKKLIKYCCASLDPCSLNDGQIRSEENTKNVYNHNFEGKFCVCNELDDEIRFMIRCLHCLDWFHLDHLNIKEEIQGIVEENEKFSLVICGDCKNKYYKFLLCYGGGNIYYTEEEIKASVIEEEEKKVQEKAKIKEDPIVLGKRPRPQEEPCDIQIKLNEFENMKDRSPIFLKEDWNNNLCYCDNCIAIYKRNNIYDILNEDLSKAESWEQINPQETSEFNQLYKVIIDKTLYNKALQELSKLDHMTQSVIASLYRQFYDDFKDFFEEFKDKETLITQKHIEDFFEYLKTKKNDATSSWHNH